MLSVGGTILWPGPWMKKETDGAKWSTTIHLFATGHGYTHCHAFLTMVGQEP